MRFLLLFILFFTFSFSKNTININSDTFKIQDFEIGYFINDNDKFNLEDINSIKFLSGKNSDTLGAKVKDTWVKIKLFNSTEKKQRIFLHQDLAFTCIFINYYEVDNKGKLLNKKEINIYDSTSQQLYGSDAIFEFDLAALETKTIFVRQITPAYHFYNFSIFSDKESKEYLIYEKVDGVLFFGLLIALAIYNMFIFISSRYKEYLYYSLYLISATTWIFYMYGSLAHYLNIYGAVAVRFNFGLMLTPVFLALFVQSIFETKEKYKTEHKFLNSIIIVLLSNSIYGIINFNHSLELLSISLNYSLLVFLFISLSIYKKGNKIIKIFLFAHIFYLIFSISALMFYTGNIAFSYIPLHGIGIGIIIEALMLSYLVSYKFKVIEEEKEEQRKLKHEAIEKQHKSFINSQKLKNINKELKNISITDKLTNIYNRAKLDESLEYQINYSKRYNETFGLMIIDIDFFKNVNDTFGHQVGDTVLVEFANILKSNIRETDILGRWGGEEFIIICPKSNLEETNIVAKKIKQQIETFKFTKIKKKTASFGITIFKSSDTLATILSRVDEALYKAKDEGRNKICIK
jgi:diguanylate cyclase (GGDEF)-like protein